MKVLLVAVNSKYSHTSLSVRTLCANSLGAEFAEYTINEDISAVVSSIIEKKPDVLCFACYIWNIECILKLASDIKKIIPSVKIAFGGPEVSFCAAEILENHNFVDCVIIGEGEETFKELSENGFIFEGVRGVAYRDKETIQNPPRPLVENLDSLAFPYTDDDLRTNSNKLIYYESSRGCPYCCSYCLSSTVHGVRFKSMDKVKGELLKIIEARPGTVKFVDRTFNADKSRTTELIEFMKKEGRGITFHFEIEAHTLNEVFFEAIKDAPQGMFRFEIGLQSTNSETLHAINRMGNTEKLFENVRRITDMGNIHVHLDLIAGLPHENIHTFEKSFNDAISLKPHVLQLGFLKLLKGTEIRKRAKEYGYVYRDYPPYEVIQSGSMTAMELLRLKKLEELLDRFYNSGAFKGGLEYLMEVSGSPWKLFSGLTDYFEDNGLFDIKHSRESLYKILCDFAEYKGVPLEFWDILKFDYFTTTVNASTPLWSKDGYDTEFHKRRVEVIEENPDDVFGALKDEPVKNILKLVHFETFSYRIFDGNKKEKWMAVFTKQGKFLGEIPNYYIKSSDSV